MPSGPTSAELVKNHVWVALRGDAWDAAQRGDLEALKKALDHLAQYGISVNCQKYDNHTTLLSVAVVNHHNHIVAELISRGMSVDMWMPISLLEYAIKHEGASTVKLLLDAKSRVHNGCFYNEMDAAVSCGNFQIYNLLKASGAKIIDHQLYTGFKKLCGSSTNKQFMCELLNSKVSLEYRKYILFNPTTTGNSPLHVAAANLNTNFIQVLLKAKADPNARNEHQHTYQDIYKAEKERRIDAYNARIASKDTSQDTNPKKRAR